VPCLDRIDDAQVGIVDADRAIEPLIFSASHLRRCGDLLQRCPVQLDGDCVERNVELGGHLGLRHAGPQPCLVVIAKCAELRAVRLHRVAVEIDLLALRRLRAHGRRQWITAKLDECRARVLRGLRGRRVVAGRRRWRAGHNKTERRHCGDDQAIEYLSRRSHIAIHYLSSLGVANVARRTSCRQESRSIFFGRGDCGWNLGGWITFTGRVSARRHCSRSTTATVFCRRSATCSSPDRPAPTSTTTERSSSLRGHLPGFNGTMTPGYECHFGHSLLPLPIS